MSGHAKKKRPAVSPRGVERGVVGCPMTPWAQRGRGGTPRPNNSYIRLLNTSADKHYSVDAKWLPNLHSHGSLPAVLDSCMISLPTPAFNRPSVKQKLPAPTIPSRDPHW